MGDKRLESTQELKQVWTMRWREVKEEGYTGDG